MADFDDYAATANAEICLMVQAESGEAIANIDAIAGTEGVDCVFIGPADLSASMGYPGRPDAPEVVEAIEHSVARIRAAGKAAGIITFDPTEIGRYAGMGVTFLGTGADVATLAKGLRDLASVARDATTLNFSIFPPRPIRVLERAEAARGDAHGDPRGSDLRRRAACACRLRASALDGRHADPADAADRHEHPADLIGHGHRDRIAHGHRHGAGGRAWG